MADPFADDFTASRLVAEPAPGSNAPDMSVTELSAKLKRVVEGEFGHVRIRGEISGWKRAASGHAYLALKDDGAVIDAVIWRGSASALQFAPADGIEVIATGKLTTYPGRSKYQIVIDRMELAGEGALMALLEKLKAKLSGEGLFDPARKQPLPYLPRVIGVVTSPTGAVIRDILHRLEDRCPCHVLVWPVKVQGAGAAAEIAAAVRGFDALPESSDAHGARAGSGQVPRPDLVIVARGGGSIEDLWAFNEEAVVRAVADCTIPIISAVGHETDTSLCDFAADLRAPTPTAAAEFAVPVKAELQSTIAALSLRTERCARRYHERGAERLAALVRVLPRRDAILGPQRQRADDLTARLGLALERRLAVGRRDLDRAGGALRPAILDARLAAARTRLRDLGRLLESVDPDKPLDRGYARVEARATGRVVASAADARAAGALTITFRDGAVAARLERGTGKAYAEPPEQPSLL